MRRTHGVTHWRPETCDGCRYTTVGVAPSAMPSRHPQAVDVNQREDRWQRDIPAYKRLRKQGYQPNRVDGAREVEQRAESAEEITLGRKLSPDGRKMAKEMNL